MSQFTASEVRTESCKQGQLHRQPASDMLNAYADRLEVDEKAMPVATVVDQFGFPLMEWIGDAGDRCPVGTKLYTHPSPADAERLADQRDDAFQQAVQEARRVWMDEFPCDAGHDHVTPFDQFLYGNRPCMKAQSPVTNTASEVRERKRFEDWYTTHTFNYSRDPIGSRDCSLQWEAWKAALAAHSAQAQPNIPDLTDEEWEILFHLYPELKARLQKVFDAHFAQAQPPAASVPTMRYFIGGPKACAYVDKFEHVEAVITALCDCTGDARDDYTSTDLLASERVR